MARFGMAPCKGESADQTADQFWDIWDKGRTICDQIKYMVTDILPWDLCIFIHIFADILKDILGIYCQVIRVWWTTSDIYD